jgi:addiction module HigA family antidote
MVRIPSHREPTHPGKMLLEEFLIPMGITQRELTYSIHVPYQRINEIVNKKRGDNSKHCLATCQVFRHVRGFLDKSAITVGSI